MTLVECRCVRQSACWPGCRVSGARSGRDSAGWRRGNAWSKDRANDELEKSSRSDLRMCGISGACGRNAERVVCYGEGSSDGERQGLLPDGGMVQRRKSARADAGGGKRRVSTTVETRLAEDQGAGIQHGADLGGVECRRAARRGVSPGESGFASAAG